MFIFGESQAPDKSKMITEATESDVISCDIVSKKSKVDQMIVHVADEVQNCHQIGTQESNDTSINMSSLNSINSVLSLKSMMSQQQQHRRNVSIHDAEAVGMEQIKTAASPTLH